MNATVVGRDERSVAVENASYRWGYLVLTFGLLLSVMYRSFTWNEAPWDLLGLVILGGFVTTLYQAANQILGKAFWVVMLVTGLIAAVLAATIAYLR